MPLNPSPLIAMNLGLIVQPLLRTDMSRAAEITFAVDVIAGASAANAQDAVDDFQANFVAQWTANLDSQCQILPPSIRLGDGTSTPYEAVAAGATSLGGSGSTFMPPNVALLLKKNTGFGGRFNHGRTYFPFILQDAQVNENGSVPGATQAVFDGIAATFLAQLTTDGTAMVIAQKVFNVPLAPHYVTHINMGQPVTSYKSEPLIATQRRRLGR